MRLRLLLPAIAIAGLTYAQYSKPSPAGTPGLPDCSHTCLENTMDPSGQCWAVDLACMCASYALLHGFLDKFGDCLLQKCNEDDITAFVQVLIDTCVSVTPVVSEPTSPSKNLLHLRFAQLAKTEGYSLHTTSLAIPFLALQTTTTDTTIDATVDATTDPAAMKKFQTQSTESLGIETDTASSPTPKTTDAAMFMPSPDASGGITSDGVIWTSMNGTGTSSGMLRETAPSRPTKNSKGVGVDMGASQVLILMVVMVAASLLTPLLCLS